MVKWGGRNLPQCLRLAEIAAITITAIIIHRHNICEMPKFHGYIGHG